MRLYDTETTLSERKARGRGAKGRRHFFLYPMRRSFPGTLPAELVGYTAVSAWKYRKNVKFSIFPQVIPQVILH
jgi:hypothetical protein